MEDKTDLSEQVSLNAQRHLRMEKPVTIMITRLERDLILRYGYPFEDIERQLEEGGDLDALEKQYFGDER